MKKAQSLRAAIAAAIPEFRTNPERLTIWVENGEGISRMTQTLAFGFTYRLNVLLVECTTDIAVVALAVFRWLRINQPDLMVPGAKGFGFDADILDNGSADIQLQLDLTEQITVQAAAGGGYDLEYLEEPDPLMDDVLGFDGGDGPLAPIPDLAEVRLIAEPDTP